MSHRLSADFDGSISLPPAIPRAFICLSLTTVCLNDRLTAHSHSEASTQPCSSHSKIKKNKKTPHIPFSMTTTISEGRFGSETSPLTPSSLSFLWYADIYVSMRPLTDYSLLLLGLPQAHSCPKLESYMYKQFVIPPAEIKFIPCSRACRARGNTSIICGIFMTLICTYQVVSVFVSSLICFSKLLHDLLLLQLVP